IVKSPNDSFDLIETTYSNGATRKEAIDNASRINYTFNQTDSIIRFERFYTMDQAEKWRSQKVQLILRVPVGGRVRLDNSLRHLINDISNIENIYDDDMMDRTWVMTDKGLSCEDCTGNEKIVSGHV